MASLFSPQVDQVNLPDVTGLVSKLTSLNRTNPFTTFNERVLNPYLQGQHNIGVAEAENALLNADTREATLAIMDRLRKSGITETQLKEADAQGILDKNTEMDFRKAQEEHQRLTTEIAKKNQVYLDQERQAENLATRAKLDILKYGPLMAPEIVQHYRELGVKNPLVLGKLLQIAPEGSLKELPEVSKGFDQLVLPGMPGYIEESEAKRNELIRQGEMLGYFFDENGNLVTSKDSFNKGVDELIKSRGWSEQNADHIAREYERAYDAFKGLFSEARILEAARAVYNPDTFDLVGSPGSINLDDVRVYLERFGNEADAIKHLTQTLKATQGLSKGSNVYKTAKTNLDTELASIDANDAPEYMKIRARERAKSRFQTEVANVVKGLIALEDRAKGNPFDTAKAYFRDMKNSKIRPLPSPSPSGQGGIILNNILNKIDYSKER